MAWEDWEDPRKATLWNALLDIFEKAAGRLQDARPATPLAVTRTRWDIPEIEIRWESAPEFRNLHVVIHGDDWPLSVEFSGAVWVDPPGAERDWKELNLGEIPLASLEEAELKVYDNLVVAFDQINKR